MTFVFKLSPDLERIIAHTIKHTGTCRIAYMDETGEDSLWLVKDSGAYLMASTRENLPLKSGSTHALVVYAEGMTPDDEWIGGDDFAENVPLQWFTDAISKGHTLFIINAKADTMEFTSK